MSPSELIALAAVGTTAILGIGTVLNNRGDRRHREREADQQRAHAERIARAERIHRARLDAYVQAARILEVSRLFVLRTLPVIAGV